MADVSVKMGVSGIGQFKQGMSQAQANIKSVDAALKVNEKQLKLTGDAETYMQQKTQLLASKLQAQKSAVANADAALRQMKASGVDPLSTAYQNMQTQMLNATAAMMETETALQGVGQSADTAGKKTDAMAQNLQSINKKMSLEQVKGAIDNITSGMEAAAKKALELGNNIRESILEAASWADDAATAAQMYGIPLQQYLQMEALVATGMDTSVDAILTSQQKLKKGIGKESKETMNTLKELGLAVTEYGGKTSEGFTRLLYDDPEQMFWEAGKAIMAMGDAYEQEAAAQQLFGKSWRELVPLFTEFDSKESFTTALEGMNTNSDETVEKLAELNDALSTLEHDFTVLKTEVLGALAPALQAAAEAISGMLKSLTEYLQTDEGKQQLQAMADALTAIINDITNIDPEKVTQGFADIISGITDTFKWIEEHWDAVKTGLIGIAAGFGMLKLASAGITIAQLFSGLKGGASAAAGAGASAAGSGAAGAGAAGAGANATQAGAARAGANAAGAGKVAAAATGTGLFSGGASAGGIGTGIAGAGTLSLGTVFGGIGLIGAGVYGLSEVVNGLNESAQEARQVSTDIHRFDDFLTQEAVKAESELTNAGGVRQDKRKIIQDTVRTLLKADGSTEGVNGAEYQLRWLAANMNTNLLEMFNYENTNGESRNKLFDMMQMDPKNQAAAAMMLYNAGFRPNGDARLTEAQQTLFSDALGQYFKTQEPHSGIQFDYTEALSTITDFFKHSGTTNENGEWTIPGLEEDTAAQAEAAAAMNSAAEVMSGLPDAVAGAVSQVRLQVDVQMMPHANGLAYVPFDGYLAMLHKGERVMTARENAQYSRSYNSNLYVESMYMNNGADAEGLAAEMAAAQRRTMSGFGS